MVPDELELKQQIMWEMHEVPYSGHLGYYKTLKNIQRSFYWPEHTLDIRDGQTEAMNLVLEMVLYCTLHRRQEGLSWEHILSIVEFAINNSLTQVIGYTPFYLNYSFYLCSPVDLVKDNDSPLIKEIDQFIERMRNFSLLLLNSSIGLKII